MLIQVTLVGGGTLHQEGLRLSLDKRHFVVVAEMRDLRSMHVLMTKGMQPQLLIADFSRQSDRDFDGLRRLRDAAPDCRTVVLASELILSDLAQALRAGADGYLVSELSSEAFSLSLLVVMSGEKVLPGSLADALASDCNGFSAGKISNDHCALTGRERQILNCLVNGYSNKLIARVLSVSVGTVKVHMKSLMKKIAAANRTQAALWARSHAIGESFDPLDSNQTSTNCLSSEGHSRGPIKKALVAPDCGRTTDRSLLEHDGLPRADSRHS
jgi:two-component system nitrate/nitrite response regulator NarL